MANGRLLARYSRLTREIASGAALSLFLSLSLFHDEICEDRGDERARNMLSISTVRSILRESFPPKLRDKRLILQRLAEPRLLVLLSDRGREREESIKGADEHCLAFSAGPTFATCIEAPSASRWTSRLLKPSSSPARLAYSRQSRNTRAYDYFSSSPSPSSSHV